MSLPEHIVEEYNRRTDLAEEVDKMLIALDQYRKTKNIVALYRCHNHELKVRRLLKEIAAETVTINH